ncbi:chorismate mutase [Roseospirillum parvum]|uniref:chorismate mutase n=1 Tax=Roseospirillum parvum TaxID=83401 RepID=A0A1G8CH67_9PROT|nr:chorismate mutase [Roseospirillum parvum]SDH44775.1 isochorismate pyruvate lyase [Roseospirillum parvum]
MTQPAGKARICRSLDEVRAEIDRLDRLIVPLLAERAGYVAQAAGFKPTRADVVIPARIEDVVAKARETARGLGMDLTLIEDIYRSLIDAHIRFEQREWDLRNAPVSQSCGG